MKAQAANLTNEQKIKIAEFLSGRTLGVAESGDAKSMSNGCSSNPPVRNEASAPSWNGWSADALANTRYQSARAAGLSPASVARLQLKWAFGLPATYSAYGQPTIVDGHVFIGSDSGYFYSIDAATGCVHWSFQAQAGLRSTAMIAPVKPGSSRMAAFFGDIRGNIYSLDATSGELLWKVPIDPHPLSRIMAAVKVYDGRVYVPVANREETTSAGYDYVCCTSRGIVVALDSATGSRSGRPTPFRKLRARERTRPASVSWDHRARAYGARWRSIPSGGPSMFRRAMHSPSPTWAARTP